MKLNDLTDGSPPPRLKSFSNWLRELGASRVTGWRWRERGWLATIHIGGRVFISDEAIAEFHRRAKAGEFANEVVKSRKSATKEEGRP